MAFCRNCGKEMTENTRFCPNCGAAVEAHGTIVEQPGSKVLFLDRIGGFCGIILLILSLFDYYSDPALLTIVLSSAIIGGCIFCLIRKYKGKIFTIIALVLALFCLLCGFLQAKRIGLLKIPGDIAALNQMEDERDTVDIPVSSKQDETIDSPSDAVQAEVLNPSKEEEISGDVVQLPASTEEIEEIPSDNAAESTVSGDEAGEEVGSADTDAGEKDKDKDKDNVSLAPAGLNPELKESLDSYEKFVDEYVAFMKKYNANPTSLELIGSYAEMMLKYAEFADKIDGYDSDDMSDADLKYYLEVTTRCTQKMLDIY